LFLIYLLKSIIIILTTSGKGIFQTAASREQRLEPGLKDENELGLCGF